MNAIKEPEGVDFTVVPNRFTDEEAKEMAEYIRKFKAGEIEHLDFIIMPADQQELDFLKELFQRMNLKWTLVHTA